ncbi:NADPH-dependent FMN reductase family protein [Hypoxylon trugodes]|uniref:NADPH-dependent FMN reductase family protein n=1 Tax=Hypoxylon trugodes TaxID=326681 RepID=UPI00218ECAB7|nr:NADPH-dependent FMN reductase family protein [Hypoxylon trugodes]KAI1391114.1 NADPH-dependent FMN reductase family protein [Hypoxylon trugodes]
MAAKSIALITMSTRGARVGPTVADFVKKIIEPPLAADNISVASVDVVKFNLPVYNEAVAPAMVPDKASFQYAHSKAWSAEIARHDGYILVIPEYNHGMAGGTKNAIDYLMHEWKGKPAAIVSYGGRGGTTASEQVRNSLSSMGLRVAETRPSLSFNQPDVMAAVGTGKLGEATLKTWGEEKADGIRKTVEELRELLLQPNAEGNVAKP